MYKYHVIGNQKLTPTTLLLTLEQDPFENAFSFQPGQYAAISFKNHGRPTPVRCFSMASSPTDQKVLQFSIRTKGRFTNALMGTNIGDEVNVRGPFGGFVFDTEKDKDLVFIAGGIGVAPLISMIHYATNMKLSNDITLIYSCSNQDDIPFIEQLKSLVQDNPRLNVVFVISKGPIDKLAGLNVISGRIIPEIINQYTNNSYTNKKFFICGPPSFMNAMVQTLQTKGIADNKIITEAFSQGSHRQTSKINSWPFNIYALGAVGAVFASFTVMVSDLMATLPTLASPTPASTCTTAPTISTNKRERELGESDELDYNFPNTDSSTVVKCTPLTTAGTTTPKCTTTQSGVTTCI